MKFKRNDYRNTAEDGLTDRQFELLLEACDKLKPPKDLQARFIILLAGRLGMRAGEISHTKSWWVDWKKGMINIPVHEPCECGYCAQHAMQRVKYNENGLTFEEAMKDQWGPKTWMAARAVPYDFDSRVELIVERFFEEYDEYPRSRLSVNRRIKEVAVLAGFEPARVYPHCLRATAASYHAARGLDAIPLQAFMGWSDISTAQKYVRLSGDHTSRALKLIHSR